MITDKTLKGALLKTGTDDSRLQRALALDRYLTELEDYIAEGRTEEAKSLVARMRQFISWATKHKAD